MYDIIGDVHGHADALGNLLVKLGYYMVDGIYQHPDRRQLIFVGDLIDRGSQIRETLQLVKNMCDVGDAQVVMGNHEYNAICFHTPHIEKGGFFRNHSLKEIKQHIRTLEQFEGYERPKSIEELLLDCSVPENEQLRNALQTREMRKVQSTSGSHPLPNNAMVAVGGLSPLNMYAR